MSVTTAKILDRLAGGIVLKALRPVRLMQDLMQGTPAPLTIREIAVVKFWGLGNAALLLPVLKALRSRYPAARLTVVTLAQNRALYRRACDDVIGVRMSPVTAAPTDLLRAVAVLRRRRIDLALDFEQYVRTSQVLLYLSGARQILAFDTTGLERARLATVKVPYRDDLHVSESFLHLAQAAGVRESIYRPGGLTVHPEAAERAQEWCDRNDVPPRALVLLHPGSGDNFPGRRWSTRRFGLLARRIVDETQACVAVTGAPGESALVREVVEASERPLQNACGRGSLEDLIALLARAELLVSNDTGPVHLASALGVPVFGLYGPNTPRLYGPLSQGSRAFYDAPACSPCITNFNYKTSRCLNPVCIDAIPTLAVAEAALARLAQRRAEKTA